MVDYAPDAAAPPQVRTASPVRRYYVLGLLTAIYALNFLDRTIFNVLIEPINTFDMPGYFLTTTEEARDIIGAVGAPNLGLQFDLYHRERMQGRVIEAIGEFAPLARHYQCANPPDRSEPACDVIDYAAVFQAIDATGFEGWIGCEYRPRAGTLPGLSWPAACGVALG